MKRQLLAVPIPFQATLGDPSRCAPIRGRLALLPLASLVLLIAVSGCGSANVQRQHLDDGSYRVTCADSMAGCLREVEALCRDHTYRIVEGYAGVRTYGIASLPTESSSAELVVRCGEKRASKATPAAGAVASAESAPKANATCSPGSTQTCVGPGACAGGQACLPDASGYAPCDCGTVRRDP